MYFEYNQKMRGIPIGLLILALAVSTALMKPVSDEKIVIENGIITINGYEDCSIQINGNSYNYTGPAEMTLPGLHFGLIEYACGRVRGLIASPLKCINCGAYCLHNEYISGCEQGHFKMLIVIVVSIVLSSLFTLMIACILYKYENTIVDRFYYLYYILRDRNERKRSSSLSRRIGYRVKPVYDELNNIRDESLKAKIMQTRSDGDEHELSFAERTQPMIKPRSSIREPDGISKAKAVLVAGAVLTSSLDLSRACDLTMYFKGNDQVCNNAGCRQLNLFTFPLLTSQVACFETREGETMRVEINDMEYRFRYKLSYFTSNYSIVTKSYWNCEDSGDCKPGKCQPSTLGKFVNRTPVEDFGCSTTSANCGTYCFFSSACIFWHWSLTRVGDLIPVYEIVSHIWTVTLKVTFKGNVYTIPFTTNRPTHDVLETITPGSSKLPMIVTGFMAEHKYMPKHVTLLDGELFSAHASNLGLPQSELLGDYQISITGRSEVFSGNGINCRHARCKMECFYPEPPISRFMSNKAKLLKFESWDISPDKTEVDISSSVTGTVSIMIGDVNINNIRIRPAKCDIKLITTYGCTGCATDSYAVFQAFKIKEPGLVTFTSNCTFDVDYLSCSEDLYKLVLKDTSKYCWLDVPSLNLTFMLNVTYVFKGELDPIRMLHSGQDTWTSITNAITTPDFIENLLHTTMLCTIIGSILTLSLRVINAVIINRTALRSTKD